MNTQEEVKTYYKENPNAPILNARPESMSFDAYKIIQRLQKNGLKKYKQGQLVYVAKNLRLKDEGVSFIRKKKANAALPKT